MTNDNTITTGANYLPTQDENGKPMIDPTYYKNIITDHINHFIEESQANPYKPTIDPDKLTNNQMLTILKYIYQSIFTNPSRAYITDRRCNVPYTDYNINTLYLLYMDIVQSYGCIPSFYGFSSMTGLSEDIIHRYVTSSDSEITNTRREMLRNLLADDKTGRIVLANNDSSFGLEYERKNTVERETIRRGLGVQDLPRLAET